MGIYDGAPYGWAAPSCASPWAASAGMGAALRGPVRLARVRAASTGRPDNRDAASPGPCRAARRDTQPAAGGGRSVSGTPTRSDGDTQCHLHRGTVVNLPMVTDSTQCLGNTAPKLV